jgi:5-methylthioadenosine/S-adenosylhomocysteine deaminase
VGIGSGAATLPAGARLCFEVMGSRRLPVGRRPGRAAIMFIVHDAILMGLDEAGAVMADAAIAVRDGRIVDVGRSHEVCGRHPDAELVPARGKAVLPGFANVHTHFSLIIAKGIYEDLSPPNAPPFTGGLSRIPVPELDAEEMRAMVRLAALEAIRSGTTAVLEDGSEIATYAADLARTGLRLLLCERVWDKAKGGIGDQGGFETDPAIGRAGIARFEALHRDWHGAEAGRIEVGIAAWAPDMCSPELLRELRALQDARGCIATIHLNQLWGEVAAVEAVRGRLPTEYLADIGFLSERLICAHCRCMAPREETTLGAAHAAVAFNSAIAARRGLSPRIHELEEAGCRIAMGSDNMAEDMVEVMRTGLFMERVRRGDGRQPTPEDALRWATVNGYRAMGIDDAGILAPGQRADFIVVDLERAHLVPHLRPVSTFVHQGQAGDVEAVVVDGRWLMRDGRVLTMDEDAVVARAQAVAKRAWRRLFEQRPDLPWPDGFAWSADGDAA